MGDVANPNRGRPRGGRPPAWLLAAAACALAAAAWGGSGIGLNVLHGFAEPWAGPDACADGPCTVRFMAYNIQWGLGADGVHDLDRIAAVLRRADADVVVLTEVDVNWRRSGNVHQPAYLAAAAGYPHWFFGASLTTWASGNARLSHYGNLLLSRFPIVRAQTVRLPRPWGREPRSLLLADIVIGGRQVTVAGTHLGLNRQERLAQAARIREWSAHGVQPRTQEADADDPIVILMGDFNAPPSSPEITLLTGGPAGLIDAHADVPGAGGTFPYPEPSARIDYIFVSENVAHRVVAAGALSAPGSDHLPVTADIAWPQQDARPLASASGSR